MRIGFFTDGYLPALGGIVTSVRITAEALEKRGHKVYIIAPKHPKYKDKGKNVYRLTSIKFLTTPEVRLALQLPERSMIRVFRHNFDVIHGHGGGPITFLGLQTARLKGIPYIATYHTLWNRYTHYFLKGKVIPTKMADIGSRMFGNVCDSIIAPSEIIKRKLVSYGVKSPIKVLPTGININSFRSIEKEFVQKKIKIKNKKKILLYVGRLGKEKSVDFLINAFSLIYKKDKNTCLVLVGNGNESKTLKQAAKDLGLSDKIFFLGAVNNDDIPKVYADADVFIFASKTETQGMVLLESFASGVPVVAVSDHAFRGVLKNGINGYAVKNNYNDFAEKTLHLINNPKTYKSMSDEAKKTAEEFSADIIAERLEKIYLKMIRDHAKRSKDKIKNSYFRTLLAKIREQMKN